MVFWKDLNQQYALVNTHFAISWTQFSGSLLVLVLELIFFFFLVIDGRWKLLPDWDGICQMGVNRASCWWAKCTYVYFNKFLVQVILIHKEGEIVLVALCIFKLWTYQSYLNGVLPYSATKGYMQKIRLFFFIQSVSSLNMHRASPKKREKYNRGWGEGTSEIWTSFFCVYQMNTCQSTLGFFYIFWKSGLRRAFRELQIAQSCWAHRSRRLAKAMGKAGSENQISVPIALISLCLMESTTEIMQQLPEAHSLTPLQDRMC